MAIAFRAISAQVTQQTNSLTINKPTGTAENDLLILSFAADSALTITPPSGFSLHASEDANFPLHRIYYKVAGASEGSTYAVGMSGTDYCYGHIAAYSGVNTADPFSATPSAGYTSGTGTVTAPGITTDAADSLLVACAVSLWGATNYAATGFTFREPETADVYMGLGDVAQASAGASGDKVITVSDSSNGPKSAILLALNPATGGGSDVSITAGAGALTIAGQTPGRTTQWYRNPGAGALTAGGYAPTFIERGLRYAYPTADVSDGTWLPSTGTDLYAAIDEEPASDTDYIYANAAGACQIRLLPVTDPVASSGYAVNYRMWSPVGGNAVVRLKQGTTTIAEWTHTGLPTSPTEYSQSLSGAQADSITDHDDLRLEFEAT